MMIAELSRWLRPNGSTLAVCRLRPELKQMMQTLHVGDTIPMFTDKPTALMATW
jgi:hypothetical protein